MANTYAIRVVHNLDNADLDTLGNALIATDPKNIEKVEVKRMGQKDWTEVKSPDFVPAAAPAKEKPVKASGGTKTAKKSGKASESDEVLGDGDGDVETDLSVVDNLDEIDVDTLLAE